MEIVITPLMEKNYTRTRIVPVIKKFPWWLGCFFVKENETIREFQMIESKIYYQNIKQ